MSRRPTLWLSAFTFIAGTALWGQTGTPPLQPFESFVPSIMSKYGVPGGSLAIVRNGKLILARGYGLIDQTANTPAQPDTLYRIASLSKTITAVSVMHLVETGKLSLDAPAFALLPDLQANSGVDKDPRLKSITIRHLLTHTGGWDAGKTGFDPTGAQGELALEMGVPAPVSSENMVRYMRGQMLDNDPGLHYAYSNFGYDVLGRILDRVTGMSYEQFVRTQIFAPMGIRTARIANSLEAGRLPGEGLYFANQFTNTIFPDIAPKWSPVAYNGNYFEGFDADGGWLISAIDYAKFISAIDGMRGSAFLKPATIATMTARPSTPDWNGQTNWYACGLAVQPTSKGQLWWNDGAIDGTFTYFFRTDDGTVAVVFFNSRSNPPGRESALANDTINGLNDAVTQMSNWPTTDYSSQYPDADVAGSVNKPAINSVEGVRNGASFDRGITSGSWATVFGLNLSKSTRSWNSSDIIGDQLPTSLDGVSVKVNGQAAFISYVSPRQINFQVPSDLSAGWPTVEVTNNGVSTGVVLTHVAHNSPAPFTFVRNGTKFAAATKADGTLLDGVSQAAPGEVISVYLTGLAPSTAGSVVAKPQRVGAPTVMIGFLQAEVQYAGLVGPGLYQINIVVPTIDPGLEPIVITANGVGSQQGIYLPIAASK